MLIGHSLGGAAVLAAARGEFQRRKRVGAYSPTSCSGSSPGAKNHDFTHYCLRESASATPSRHVIPATTTIKPPQCWGNWPRAAYDKLTYGQMTSGRSAGRMASTDRRT